MTLKKAFPYLFLLVFTLLIIVTHISINSFMPFIDDVIVLRIYGIQFILSILLYKISSLIHAKKKEQLGYVFLITTTLKTILFYILLSVVFFPNQKWEHNTKVFLVVQFLIYLGVDVFLTARLLNSNE
ncbi:hypothetical protein [Flavobacterium sp.]|uniref:hypothetical protein n=1 Tax=Flavobacterium sp. TaxID=239 RepID=UPI0025BA0AAA|nr:hypothetical protein [Flavobacterium sp.]